MANKVLHTAARYAAEMIENLEVQNMVKPKLRENPQEALIQNMKANEAKIYSTFFDGCTTIESFIQKIRALFTEEYLNDQKFLQYFDNTTGFQQRLIRDGIFERVDLYPDIVFKIECEIDNDKYQEVIKKTITPRRKRIRTDKEGNYTASSKKQLEVYDPAALAIKGKLVELNIQDFSGIQSGSPNMTVVLERISDRPIYDLIGQSFVFENKTGDKKYKISLDSGSKIDLTQLNTSFSMPLEYVEKGDQAEVDRLIGNTVQKLFVAAIRFAGNQISAEMADCYCKWAEEYLNGQINKTGYMTAAANWNKVVGNLGEIKGELLLNYLDMRQHGKHFGEQVKSVIGDMYGKEQARSDIQITIQDFVGGLQVKNYNPGSKKITEDGGVSLSTTQDYLKEVTSGGLKSGVLRTKLEEYIDVDELDVFLANYAFISFGTVNYETVKKDIEDALGEIFAIVANYDTQNELRQYWDVNNLYLIGGQYLVPTSWLYEQACLWMNSMSDKNKVKISIVATPQYTHDDLFTSAKDGKPILEKYRDYWKYSDGQWSFTNPDQFNNMLSKVRFATHISPISYRNGGLGQFALY